MKKYLENQIEYYNKQLIRDQNSRLIKCRIDELKKALRYLNSLEDKKYTGDIHYMTISQLKEFIKVANAAKKRPL